MNRDEILNMPSGRLMDTLVAEKVMGWTYGQTGDDYEGWSAPHGGYANERARHGHFYPSTDISAAWEVVEKNRGEAFSLLKSPVYGGYLACFYVNKEVLAHTAPLAICRAALLAVLESK